MSQKERERSLTERRLLRASEHVNNFWFPVNPELHQKIKDLIHKKEGLDASALINEVRGDFSLFLYCIRETAALLKEEGVEVPITKHPLELLEWAGIQRLKKILDVETTVISPHTLEKAHLFQKIGIEEAAISASASQVLSDKLGLTPDLAFTTALLRNLGYALVAWNYAGVYHQALMQVRPAEPLDAVLTRLLGFSPTTLGMVIVQDWGLPSYIQRAMDSEEVSKRPGTASAENTAITQSLVKICKIGEALARANNPEFNPSAFSDWNLAKKEITELIGPNGIQKIKESVATTAGRYVELLPQIFKGAFVLDPDVKLKDPNSLAQYEVNPYVHECSGELREQLKDIYRKMAFEDVPSLVRILVKDILPTTRFSKGCVYTVDPGSAWLIPQLGIGGANIAQLKARPVRLDEQETDVIIRAFNSNEIIVGSAADADSPHSFLARTLGYSQRYGVLYLETPQMLNELLTNTTRTEFNALALTLTDCLTLVK